MMGLAVSRPPVAKGTYRPHETTEDLAEFAGMFYTFDLDLGDFLVGVTKRT
jgi:hypothetical protein